MVRLCGIGHETLQRTNDRPSERLNGRDDCIFRWISLTKLQNAVRSLTNNPSILSRTGFINLESVWQKLWRTVHFSLHTRCENTLTFLWARVEAWPSRPLALALTAAVYLGKFEWYAIFSNWPRESSNSQSTKWLFSDWRWWCHQLVCLERQKIAIRTLANGK